MGVAWFFLGVATCICQGCGIEAVKEEALSFCLSLFLWASLPTFSYFPQNLR